MTISATNQGLRPGVCTSTSRPSTPFDGQVIYETDTDNALVWNGTAWVKLATQTTGQVGFVRVVPSSAAVAGAGSTQSVSSEGKVTYSTATSVSVNGCFSSQYTNYMVVMDYDASSASANLHIRLRVSGTDDSTSNAYVLQKLTMNSTTVSGARNTSTQWDTIGTFANVATNAFKMNVYRPFLADTTAFDSHSSDSYLNAYTIIGNGTHTQNTSYDGFTFICSSGTITGSIYVYGLAG
jgi:hypothetical protein